MTLIYAGGKNLTCTVVVASKSRSIAFDVSRFLDAAGLPVVRTMFASITL